MKDKPVYSTAGGDQRSAARTPGAGGDKPYKASPGPVKMRLETKGRGGKVVTLLFNLTYPSAAAATLVMKELQDKLGCGATFKNGAIELRGDWTAQLPALFAARGEKLQRAGG